jgi:STE24 endopeptidase
VCPKVPPCRRWFATYHGIYSLIENTLLLWYGALPYIWDRIGRDVMPSLPQSLNNEIGHTIAFLLVFSLISSITGLPWSLYKTFVLEEKHGFNKQTLGLFFKDMIMQVCQTLK